MNDKEKVTIQRCSNSEKTINSHNSECFRFGRLALVIIAALYSKGQAARDEVLRIVTDANLLHGRHKCLIVA
jgi:hypothetical protein